MAAGHAFQAGQQKVVEPLALELRAHFPVLDGRFRLLRAHRFCQIVHKKVYVIVRTTDFARGRPIAGPNSSDFGRVIHSSGLYFNERVLLSANPEWAAAISGR
ncbi:MAG: hypothetical protein LOD94_04700 [Gammaproteobacteria bacterium]